MSAFACSKEILLENFLDTNLKYKTYLRTMFCHAFIALCQFHVTRCAGTENTSDSRTTFKDALYIDEVILFSIGLTRMTARWNAGRLWMWADLGLTRTRWADVGLTRISHSRAQDISKENG